MMWLQLFLSRLPDNLILVKLGGRGDRVSVIDQTQSESKLLHHELLVVATMIDSLATVSIVNGPQHFVAAEVAMLMEIAKSMVKIVAAKTSELTDILKTLSQPIAKLVCHHGAHESHLDLHVGVRPLVVRLFEDIMEGAVRIQEFHLVVNFQILFLGSSEILAMLLVRLDFVLLGLTLGCDTVYFRLRLCQVRINVEELILESVVLVTALGHVLLERSTLLTSGIQVASHRRDPGLEALDTFSVVRSNELLHGRKHSTRGWWRVNVTGPGGRVPGNRAHCSIDSSHRRRGRPRRATASRLDRLRLRGTTASRLDRLELGRLRLARKGQRGMKGRRGNRRR